MENKIILTREKPTAVGGVKPVFLPAETIEQLKSLKEETGIPMGRLADQFIRFGLSRVEVVDPAVEDV